MDFTSDLNYILSHHNNKVYLNNQIIYESDVILYGSFVDDQTVIFSGPKNLIIYNYNTKEKRNILYSGFILGIRGQYVLYRRGDTIVHNWVEDTKVTIGNYSHVEFGNTGVKFRNMDEICFNCLNLDNFPIKNTFNKWGVRDYGYYNQYTHHHKKLIKEEHYNNDEDYDSDDDIFINFYFLEIDLNEALVEEYDQIYTTIQILQEHLSEYAGWVLYNFLLQEAGVKIGINYQ